MSDAKRYWDKEYEYKRILEILDDYWLTSEDEIRVIVEMNFLKGDGEFQRKQITWENPHRKNGKEEKSTMEDIVWFNKDKTGWTQKKCDISISKVKNNAISIIIRNGWHDEITKTGYVRVGLSSTSKNKLFFMAADAEHGWKVGQQSKSSNNWKVLIKDERVADGLVRFIGDYEIEVSDDNLCFVDRKNVL